VRANSILPFKFSERGGASAGLQTQSASDFASFWARHNKSGTPYSARDVVIGSLCPQLYGLFFVKLAVLLTLVGGSETETQGGVRRRSQSHLLLVGDPGCGKSQLMRAAALISSRSVLTTGIGSTGAGLTCTAVKEPGTGSWSIEAGALGDIGASRLDSLHRLLLTFTD
jgi:DNA helicase MCM9